MESEDILKIGSSVTIGIAASYVVETVATDTVRRSPGVVNSFRDGVDPIRALFDIGYFTNLLSALYASNEGSLAKVVTAAVVSLVSITAIETTSSLINKIKG